MAKKRAKVNTRKWVHTSKWINSLPIVIYDDSVLYKKIKRYLNVVGRGVYVANYKQNIFTVNFDPVQGPVSTFSEKEIKGSRYKRIELSASFNVGGGGSSTRAI